MSFLLHSDVGSFALDLSALAKQKGNAPQASQSHQCIDDAADNAALPTKQPGHQIKLENSHQTPVEAANDGKDQCDGIQILHLRSNFASEASMPGTKKNYADASCKIADFPVKYKKNFSKG